MRAFFNHHHFAPALFGASHGITRPAEGGTAASGPKKGPLAGEPAPGLNLAMLRQSSTRLSLSATYTRAAVMSSQGPGQAPAGRMDIKMPGLETVIEKMRSLIDDLFGAAPDQAESTPAGRTGPCQDSMAEPCRAQTEPQEELKRLIVQEVFGLEIEQTSMEFTSLSGGGEGEASALQASYTRLDFTLDYKGVIRWQGQIIQTELHLELHIEQMEAAFHTEDVSSGLTLLNPQTVDTGSYFISFLNSSTLEILHKSTGLATRIWGDPHVDLSDEPGRVNGEFSDLKGSSILTTFKLLDDTMVVIKAPDDGLIQEVDIFKGHERIRGRGAGAREMPDGPKHKGRGPTMSQKEKAEERPVCSGYFYRTEYEAMELSMYLAESDMVEAGGDGNDWFSPDGDLIWGGSPGGDADPASSDGDLHANEA